MNWDAFIGVGTLLMAVATTLMAIFTLMSIIQTKKRDEKGERIRIIEEIIIPWKDVLENAKREVKNLMRPHLTTWEKFSKEKAYLIARIPKEIRDLIDEVLIEKLPKYSDLWHRNVNKLNEIIAEEIKKRKKEGAKICFELILKGVVKNITLKNLLFYNTSPKEFLSQKKAEGLAMEKINVRIKRRENISVGSSINEFEEIFWNVKEKIKNSEIEELLSTAKWLTQKIDFLISEIEKLIGKWSN